MDASNITSKTSALKSLILRAWRERMNDIQWGILIRSILPRGVSGDLYNLADCILQQAMVGCGANQVVISYLKHSLASHLVSYGAVLQRIAKFDAFHKPHCLISLLEVLESFLDTITGRGKLEEELLAFAVSSIILWLLQVYHYTLAKYPSSNLQCQELLEKITSLLKSIVNADFLLAMFYLAKQHDQEEYNEVRRKCHEITGFMMMNTQFKAPATIHETLLKICNMDLDKIAPLNNNPVSVTHGLQALIAVEVLAHPSADLQQLASQFLMIRRIKGYSLSRLYCELIRASFISLNDSSKDASKQALWAAFTFLKLPQVMHYLHTTCGTTNSDGEYSVELVDAFETLLHSNPLLDIVDTKNSCNSVIALIESLVKMNVLTESHLQYFSQKRENKDRKLQKLEPTGLQGSVPSFITRAEPTLAGVLKTLGGDFHKTDDSLYVMFCQIVGGTTLDTILAVATVEGSLKLFVSKLINFNEYALLAASEKGAPLSKTYIFDISFLILVSIVQDYGFEAVLEANGDSFFEKWVRECLPQNGVQKSPEEILHKCDTQVVDGLIHHLNSSDFDFKNNLKLHDLCLNVPGVIKEILFAWEDDTLPAADVKCILDSLRQKLASLAVCASVWLCSYINVSDGLGSLKPLNMMKQFLTPAEPELAQIDNFKDRIGLMGQIVRKLQCDIHRPNASVLNCTKAINSIFLTSEIIAEQLETIWEDVKSRGYLHIDTTHVVFNILHSAGPIWFVSTLVNETLKYRYQEDLDRSVDIVLAMFHFDIEKCTVALLLHVLSQYLYSTNSCAELVEPQSAILAKLSVYAIYAALEHTNANKSESNRKRRFEETEDSECSSSKTRRLNDNTASEADDSTLPPLSLSPPSPVALKEPLQTALETLFSSFSKLVFTKNGEVTPQTHFILQFLMYVVQCGQDRAQIVLQKMPSELLPTLIKALPRKFNINLILRLYDLTTPQGRKDTARDLCLFRNMRLRPY